MFVLIGTLQGSGQGLQEGCSSYSETSMTSEEGVYSLLGLLASGSWWWYGTCYNIIVCPTAGLPVYCFCETRCGHFSCPAIFSLSNCECL